MDGVENWGETGTGVGKPVRAEMGDEIAGEGCMYLMGRLTSRKTVNERRRRRKVAWRAEEAPVNGGQRGCQRNVDAERNTPDAKRWIVATKNLEQLVRSRIDVDWVGALKKSIGGAARLRTVHALTPRRPAMRNESARFFHLVAAAGPHFLNNMVNFRVCQFSSSATVLTPPFQIHATGRRARCTARIIVAIAFIQDHPATTRGSTPHVQIPAFGVLFASFKLNLLLRELPSSILRSYYFARGYKCRTAWLDPCHLKRLDVVPGALLGKPCAKLTAANNPSAIAPSLTVSISDSDNWTSCPAHYYEKITEIVESNPIQAPEASSPERCIPPAQFPITRQATTCSVFEWPRWKCFSVSLELNLSGRCMHGNWLDCSPCRLIHLDVVPGALRGKI
ncbi:hypothetical protein R3P38DRAFT_3343973 [Favolaschia claudopus]|uniref:Uncharacterized protein n=1 Tax=Favolaschia claudopus TaxID=2862362 RepID=A0AAW0DGR1_9AGAR